MKTGIIGLEFSGKKNLFSLLTGIESDSFKPGREQVGIVNVPDERVEYLNELYKSKKKVYSRIEFHLLPSIKKDSKETKQSLTEAREADMFVMVIRQFNDPNVYHPYEKVDVIRDYNIIKEEMILADLLLVETRLERIDKSMRAKKADILEKEKKLLLKCKEVLEEGKHLNTLEIEASDMKMIKGFQFLTLKPLFVILNCDEDKINETVEFPDNVKSLNISVKIESEIQNLDGEERAEFLESLGITQSSLDRLIKFSFNYGDLISYFTAAEQETHSWTINNGTNAQMAAGVIHSDFEKGFIRAEVIGYDDLKRAGSESEAKKMGLYRLEGKEYIVKDGDIILFRFNI